MSSGTLPPATTLRALAGMARSGARSGLVYRFDTAIGVISMAVQVVLIVVVWRTVYSGHGEVSGIDERTAVGYAVLAICFNTIITPWQFSSIPLRIRLGQIGVDLTRPIGLIGQSLAQTIGFMGARIPFGIAGLLTGLLLGGLVPPSSAGLFAIWLLSMALGVANVLLCNLIVSMIAFWTTDVGGPFMLYRFGAAFCSGALIPLWFMPTGLARLLEWLPFQAQMFAPLTIWFGEVRGIDVVFTLGVQALWVVVLAVVLHLVFARAVHKVVVQGG